MSDKDMVAVPRPGERIKIEDTVDGPGVYLVFDQDCLGATDVAWHIEDGMAVYINAPSPEAAVTWFVENMDPMKFDVNPVNEMEMTAWRDCIEATPVIILKVDKDGREV